MSAKNNKNLVYIASLILFVIGFAYIGLNINTITSKLSPFSGSEVGINFLEGDQYCPTGRDCPPPVGSDPIDDGSDPCLENPDSKLCQDPGELQLSCTLEGSKSLLNSNNGDPSDLESMRIWVDRGTGESKVTRNGNYSFNVSSGDHTVEVEVPSFYRAEYCLNSSKRDCLMNDSIVRSRRADITCSNGQDIQLNWYYVFIGQDEESNPGPEEPPVTLNLDLNGDGNIMANDALVILNAVFSGQTNDTHDLNADGDVDIRDILFFLKEYR